MLSSNDIRRLFLQFMEQKGHKIHPGISLVPTDPSIFLTTAGVVPFQAMLEGREAPPHPRIASCQRCCRTTDLEAVGRYIRYNTFFEMLGNWSFGDYFKAETLTWGWEFLTEVIGLPKDRIWVTVFGNHPDYPDDDEAYGIWVDTIGLPRERVVKLPDNWWGPVLETGACGPDSEIYYDLGPEFGDDETPGGEGDRFMEIWNHVFTQFYKQPDGSFTPLSSRNIDTGMGLERLTCVVQGRPSIYETDLFVPVLDELDRILEGATGAPGDRSDWRVRTIADHSRAATFLVMDGIYPANVGRGYVLRRIIRRAATFGYLLGLRRPFLHQLVPLVVERMSPGYPELLAKQDLIRGQIEREESQFSRTLERGVPRFLDQAREGGILDGAFAWDVYATSGVPFEVMRELAAEHGAEIDEAAFHRAREEHSLTSGKGVADKSNVRPLPVAPSRFLGYERAESEAAVLLLLAPDGQEEAAPESLEAGEVGMVVLDETPFYGESGGQIGDTGTLSAGIGGISGLATVLDTQRRGPVFVHTVRVEQGRIHAGMRLHARVDTDRRAAIRRAHTATHLLHAALRATLGDHVVQRGSVVEPDRLRFDFAHGGALSQAELGHVEAWMNREVLANHPVEIAHHSQEEARLMGAMMLFGEKYGETVRVVNIPGRSMELCGGVHAGQTGDIGLIKITSEGSAAAGVRRIECVTGLGAVAHARQLEQRLAAIAARLGGSVAQLDDRLDARERQIADLERQLSQARSQLLEARAGGKGGGAARHEVAGIVLLTENAGETDAEFLKAMVDRHAEQLHDGVVLVGGVSGGKGNFAAKVVGSALARGAHAGHLVREVARLTGGGGGGRAEFAQAGARDTELIPSALEAAPGLLEALLSR